MIVKEIRATIMCPKCGSSFEYSALSIHSRIETIHRRYLDCQLRECVRCNEADLTVRDIKCIVKSDKDKCLITWRCLHCDTTWEQHEYIDRDILASGRTISQIVTDVTCPNIPCLSKTDVLATGISKE